MKIRTALALFLGFFTAAILCWVFVELYLYGVVVIPEPSRIMAGFEIFMTAGFATLALERLFNLREKH